MDVGFKKKKQVFRSSSRPKSRALPLSSRVQVGDVRHEGLGKEIGHVMVSVCPSSSTMEPLGDLGHKPPHNITVPFKATQHLFPPIKTNNLFCRKSRQLLSAGSEAWLDGL